VEMNRKESFTEHARVLRHFSFCGLAAKKIALNTNTKKTLFHSFRIFSKFFWEFFKTFCSDLKRLILGKSEDDINAVPSVCIN